MVTIKNNTNENLKVKTNNNIYFLSKKNKEINLKANEKEIEIKSYLVKNKFLNLVLYFLRFIISPILFYDILWNEDKDINSFFSNFTFKIKTNETGNIFINKTFSIFAINGEGIKQKQIKQNNIWVLNFISFFALDYFFVFGLFVYLLFVKNTYLFWFSLVVLVFWSAFGIYSFLYLRKKFKSIFSDWKIYNSFK